MIEVIKGDKVKHSRYGEGKVLSMQGNTIKVAFGVQIKEFPYPASMQNGTLTLAKPIVLPSPQQSPKFYRNTFYCFQGNQYSYELDGGYIFALRDGIHHHERLSSVKKGDIIFHGNEQGILAVSVAETDCFWSERPESHYLANNKKDREGFCVKVKYSVLKNRLSLFKYRVEIVRLQGDCEGRAYPFNKNGTGNQGYLFNLNKSLAIFFMKNILANNSFMREMEYVQEMLGSKQQKPNNGTTSMKLCPLCNLNFIEEDKACCSICENSQPLPIIIGSTAKIGETIYAKTHADFLNQLLGTNYKSYMKSSLHLPDGKLIWMIELGSFVSSSGWINQLESNLIRETHVGEKFEYGHNTYKRALEMRQYFDSSDRVIFDIVKTGQGRKYIFRGVFRLNREKSTYNENVWELALSEYKLK